MKALGIMLLGRSIKTVLCGLVTASMFGLAGCEELMEPKSAVKEKPNGYAGELPGGGRGIHQGTVECDPGDWGRRIGSDGAELGECRG